VKLERDQIIADAQLESRLILEDSQLRIDNWIMQAKNKLRIELVESAINSAIEKLPHEITEEDNQKIIQTYLNGIASK